MVTSEPFIVVSNGNPPSILLQPHSKAEVGYYNNIQIKAVAKITSDNIILYSTTFTVEVLSSSVYPYFKSPIYPLKIYRYQQTSYTFPSMLNLRDMSYKLTLDGQLPSCATYDQNT